jgi:hypothetical protein
MSPTRPHGLGWAVDNLEVASEPPGDGIGPDHTPPDAIPGQDPREAKRLARDHRELTKAGDRPTEQPRPDLHESAAEPPTANPFAPDPREGKGDR